MQKNITAILIVICIILLSVLVISSSANGIKIKKAEAQVAALNKTIADKDGEIARLNGTVRDREQALDTMRREMDTVKTELSNTVLRMQAGPAAQKSTVDR